MIQCEALELLLSSFSLVMVGKSQVLLITVRMAPFYSKVPVCYDSVTISTRGHEMEKAKFSNHSFYFFFILPNVTYQHHTRRGKSYTGYGNNNKKRPLIS